jgi:hypothetical protein
MVRLVNTQPFSWITLTITHHKTNHKGTFQPCVRRVRGQMAAAAALAAARALPVASLLAPFPTPLPLDSCKSVTPNTSLSAVITSEFVSFLVLQSVVGAVAV